MASKILAIQIDRHSLPTAPRVQGLENKMTTINISYAINNALTLDDVVALVNEGTCEGMESMEFTSEQLAGQYAYNAAVESGCPVNAADIDAQLEFLRDAGAVFDDTKAAAHALAIARAALLLGNEMKNTVLVMADTINGNFEVSSFDDFDGCKVVSAEIFADSLKDLSDGETIGAELTQEQAEKIEAEYGITRLEKNLREMTNAINSGLLPSTTPEGVKVVSEGRHIGSVTRIEGEYAIQDVGRGDEVAHPLSRFDAPPEVGKKMDVSYVDGLARVAKALSQDEHAVSVSVNTR